MSELVFLLSAEVDIQKAFETYEEFYEGRGIDFLAHLDLALGSLRTFPEIAPLFLGNYRRLLIPRFPYAIFYSLESGRTIIAGVMYLRQNPEAISRRLRG
jgi:toxin ParE1/3/4